jgi:dipeptidyl aminopeptidase/acylaminoacyl peptidase
VVCYRRGVRRIAGWAATVAALLLAGCAGVPGRPASSSPPPRPARAASPTPAPTPTLPPYAIESLRARAYPGGKLNIGSVMFRGQGFTKYEMTWPSGGQTMTGTISLPDGPGPFPVVVVEHGFIPSQRYWVGQDSGIFGDPLAAHGFVSVAPNWPGYAGSGPAPPGLPPIVGELVTALDLISSLRSLPQADTNRIGFVGHSNGGGIALLAMVVDPRIKAVALFAPVSSDMADNARKWWLRTPGEAGPLGSPDRDPTAYRDLSPRSYFARGQPPTLIIQGTVDHTIPAAWTQATYDALQRAGVESKLVWIPGGDHDLVDGNLDRAVADEESWLRQHLSP